MSKQDDFSPTNRRVRPIIRVFVSSTFSDLKVERDALAQRVWPKLEQLCLQEGFQFQAIDLRWGIPTEAGLHHRTMRICFEELRRSQEVSPEPNFLILLGNRYGWRPLPEEISAEEFRRLEDAADQIDVVDQQQPVDVLRQWYLLDENSLTPVYILQPRRKPSGEDPAGTDYTTLEAWRPVEQTLWRIVNRAFPSAGLRNRFQVSSANTDGPPSIVRFQASATEQEIWAGALSVPNAEQHVRAFFRDISNCDTECNAGGMRDFFDFTESGDFDDAAKTAQGELKKAIERRLGKHAVFSIPFSRLKRQEGKVLVDAAENELQQFCDVVERTLTEIIERQIQEYWEPKSPAAVDNESLSGPRMVRELEIERDEHLRFGKERGSSDFFVGRDEVDGPLARIRDYLENDSRFPLVIHGESGCGKTALLARAFQEIPAAKKPIIRFLGVTPRSSDVRSLLRSLCQELRGRNAIPDRLPTDIQELTQEFRRLFNAATAERPIILFLDALDQLSDADNSEQLFWLPYGELPPNVKIVVSCLSDRDEQDPAGQPHRSLQGRALPSENWLNLDALSPDEATTLVFDRWLPAAGRKVTDAQRQLIESRLASSATCRQPLFLKLLFEEAKLWNSWDSPAAPGNSVSELLQQLCQRLSRSENHGESLVQFLLGYLGAARRGLSETEILEVLFADPDYKTELDNASVANNHTLPSKPPRIPIAIWSRLRYDLAPYLAERSAPSANVLAFYHRHLAEWIDKRFVADVAWRPHERLADYFERRNHFNVRFIDEFPWQLLAADKLDVLAATMAGREFFVQLWGFSELDARYYWARILEQTEVLPQEAYCDVLEAPQSDEPFARTVALLLHSLSLEAFAIPVWRVLVHHARRKEMRQLLQLLPPFASSLGRFGLRKEAYKIHKELHDLGLEMRDPKSVATAIAGIAAYDKEWGHFARAEQRFRLAENLMQRWGHAVYAQRNMQLLPDIYLKRGDNEKALEKLQSLQHDFERSGNFDDAMRVKNNQALALTNLGRLDDARELLVGQVKWCRSTGSIFDLQNCLGNLANTYAIQGDFDEALKVHAEEERACRQLGGVGLRTCLRNQARIYLQTGHVEHARQLHHEAWQSTWNLLSTRADHVPRPVRWCLWPVSLLLHRREWHQWREAFQ